MDIKLDENIPEDAAIIFREAGHEVSTVLYQGMGGRADPEIAAACKAESKVLITLDTVLGGATPDGLSSLATNLIVTETLDAARRSATSGQAIRLPAVP